MMFGKPVENMRFADIILPKWLNKPDLKSSFESATKEELQRTLQLPNFDFEVFEKITGITKSDFERRLK